MKRAVMCLIVFMGLDAILTLWGLSRGLVEANPLPWASPEWMMLAKLVALSIIIPMLYAMRSWRPATTFANFIAFAMAVVVVNNLWLIMQT